MNEIINLSNFLKDAFSNDSYAYRNTNEELSNIENRIAELENKLKDIENYKTDIKGATFVQEILTKHASANREENIEEYKGLIELANSEIASLQSEIESRNDSISEKINKLLLVETEEERISIQKEIRALSNEKNSLRSETIKLISDIRYFESEINKINAEINEDKMRLQELENIKINRQDLENDKKELADLKLEVSHLEKYASDLITLNNFFDIVSKIENNQEYNEEDLKNVLNDISNLSVNSDSLAEIKSLIDSKNLSKNELEAKLKDEKNYLEDHRGFNITKKTSCLILRDNNEENYKIVEQLLENLELQMEPLRNNRLEQEKLLNEISELSVRFREDATQDEYYQGEFKKLYDKLDQLKDEEKNLIIELDEANYQKNKQNLLDRKDRINKDLVHIEKLMKEETSFKLNRFKMNEDRIRLSFLESEIKSLTNIYELVTKVKEANEVYDISNHQIQGKYLKAGDVQNGTIEEENEKEDPLTNLYNQMGIDNNQLDDEFSDNINDENLASNSDINLEQDSLDNLLSGIYDSIEDKQNNDMSVENFDMPGADENTDNLDEEFKYSIIDGENESLKKFNLDLKFGENGVDISDNNESIDYNSTKNVTVIENVKECNNPKKVRKNIRTRIRAILATLLVGVATISGCASKRLQNSKDQIVKTEFSSASIDQTNKYDSIINESLKNIEDMDETSLVATTDNNVDIEKFNIGDKYIASGDIYGTSYDAKNDINGLDHYYPLTDERTVSAIQFVSPDGEQHVTVTENNKEEADLLRALGWMEESYCTSNETRDLEYEGWHRR